MWSRAQFASDINVVPSGGHGASMSADLRPDQLTGTLAQDLGLPLELVTMLLPLDRGPSANPEPHLQGIANADATAGSTRAVVVNVPEAKVVAGPIWRTVHGPRCPAIRLGIAV